MEKVAASESKFQLGDANLSGPGSTILATAINQARYVLIGEDHFSREIHGSRSRSVTSWHRKVSAR